MSEPIHGYHVPILQGVWARILTLGVPRKWCHCWAALCLALGLWLMTYYGFKWLAVPLLLWLAGHGALALLTLWNASWVDMMWAQVNQRYRDKYEAG